MRPTKFRVWCTNDVNPKGRYYYPEDVLERGVGNSKVECCFVLSQQGDLYTVNSRLLEVEESGLARARWANSGIVVEFSTGFCDRDGKEGYEGDIIKQICGNGMVRRGRIEYLDSSFIVRWDDETYDWLHEHCDWLDEYKPEIIGNIHSQEKDNG